MKTAIATLAVLTPALAWAQDWTHRTDKDDFTDEEVWIASVRYEAGEYGFSLFANCRYDGTLNVGLTSDYINPTGGVPGEYHAIPVRYDDDGAGVADGAVTTCRVYTSHSRAVIQD